ncbi:MAG: hypothetical protein ACT4PW_11685 [Acidimicrobiia bacterium]
MTDVGQGTVAPNSAVASSTSTLEGCVNLEDGGSRAVLRRRAAAYFATTVVLSALIGGAVLDGVGATALYGVQTGHARGAGGGYELDVRYGTVSRPALATPLDVTVTRGGGFDGPVTVAVDSKYLALWDENGLDPSPAEETADAEQTIWTFDPPSSGEVLAISYDARIEPAAQNGRSGRVALLDDAGSELVAVTFHTRVMP